MKSKIKVLSLAFIIMIMSLLSVNVFATTHTLNEIAEKFNNCSSVKRSKEFDNIYLAKVEKSNPNILTISLNNYEGKSSKVNYKLDESILSNDQLDMNDLYSAIILADCIGQVNGYKDGELFYTLNSEEIANYTVENEGFEFKENGDKFSIKMDIDKKIPLVDLSDFYLKSGDFDFVKKIVDEKDVGNQTGKDLKMTYDITIREEENTICIGEENETTMSTYNSILSALEVIYGDKVVEYFQSVYPKFEEGTKQLDGFTIETNASYDSGMFEGSKIVLVKVDNKYINDKVLTGEYTKEAPKTNTWKNADSWAIEELKEAEEKELIPETFQNKDFTMSINRKDFAAVAVKLYEYISSNKSEKISDNPFIDTSDDYVLKAYNLGITLGTSENTFTPNGEITREQMATMLTRAVSKAGVDVTIDLEKVSKFADDNEMHEWGKESVYFMAENGIIKGVGDNKFNSLGNAKFEEALVIALRSVNTLGTANDNQGIPKSEQIGTAGSNIPVKDNYSEAEYQIKVAMQYLLEEAYGDEVIDARIYVQKIYSAEDEQEVEPLKKMNLGPNEVAFEVKYELKIAEGVEDKMKFTAATGEYDEETGWVKEKYNLGVLRPNDSGEQKYKITDFGTGW